MVTPRTCARWILLAALLPACGDPGGSEPASTGSGDETSTTTATTSTTRGEAPTTGTSAATDFTGSESGSESGGESGATTGTSTGGTDDSSTGEQDILVLLEAVEGLTVEEGVSKIAGYRFFHLFFEQPADHDDPDGLKFQQQMTLLHRDRGAPLVLATDGYYIFPNGQGIAEPTALLDANQLRVEHRFFSVSRPEPADWSTLTIAQAAADHHRIVEALRPIYDAAWISTGASKGGMTAMFHRRFFPDDVDGTVAYVAPLSHSINDPRYIDFVQKVGEPGCRQDLIDAQRELLLRRPAMQMRAQQQADVDGFTYDILGEELALEVVVLELFFVFWQYAGLADCDEIPGAMASDDELWTFLDEFNPIRQQSDDSLLAFEPYYFQAAVELGAPAIHEEPLADLLLFPGADVPATFVVPGPGKDVMFDPAAMADIAGWVATEGDRLLLVYGEDDPWTAAEFELGAATDSLKLFVPGGNHGSKIANLVEPDRALAYQRLEAWTGVVPSARALPPEPSLKTLRTLVP